MDSSMMEMTTRIKDDAATMTRVRNRFSQSTDQQLPKIISGLIPKLFRRLEEYNLFQDQEQFIEMDISTSSYLQKIKVDIYGILATALDRIRGNNLLSTADLTTALLPSLSSTDSVVTTWTLAFLQVAIPRNDAISLDPATIPALLEALGQFHSSLADVGEIIPNDGEATATPAIAAVTGGRERTASVNDDKFYMLESQWIRVSWLLFDCVMIYSGYQPLIDFDVDTFDPKRRQVNALQREVQYQLMVEKAVQVFLRNNNQEKIAVALFSLLLDLMIFWPDGRESFSFNTGISICSLNRMNSRSKVLPLVLETIEDDLFHRPRIGRQAGQQNQQAHAGLPVQFQRPVRRGSPPQHIWSDTTRRYLQYLKKDFLEFAIGPNGKGLFNKLCINDDGCRFTCDDHILLISILTANNSMHGRISVDSLQQRKCKLLSVNVAVCILILILGEERISDVVNEFECLHGIGGWVNVIGSTAGNSSMTTRRPVPGDFTSQLVDYLLKTPIDWGSSGIDYSLDEKIHSSLLIKLALRLSQNDDNKDKFLAIRIVACICEQSQIHAEDAHAVFIAIKEVLKVFVGVGVSIQEEMRTTPVREGQLPLGVEAPFRNRNDVDRLLRTHRQRLKRKSMKRDDAVESRMEAYKLIPLLSSCIFKQDQENPFELPNLLLQCAVYEDRYLENLVIKAIKSVLCEFSRKLKEDGMIAVEENGNERQSPLQQQATSLLPSILEAIFSDIVYARRMGFQWIQQLLVKMDAEAALYLASFLVNDEDGHIATSARELLLANHWASSDSTIEVPPTLFYNLQSDHDKERIQKILQGRTRDLAKNLGITEDQSMILLLRNSFSISRAQASYLEDKDATESNFRRCGIHRSTTNCGICYEDIEESEFHLGCGHKFCMSCWKSYINSNAESPSLLLRLTCPEQQCNKVVLRSSLQKISQSALSNWDDAFFGAFLEQDSSFRYCPGPDCKFLASMESMAGPLRRNIDCVSCGLSFCFQCSEHPHAPASCESVAEWNRLTKSSQFWVKQHSKPCPGCNAPIEKHAGCNHMSCTKCGTNFCWLCLALLNWHLEPHRCDRYDPADSIEDDFERRALFTAGRFQAHEQAERFATKQLQDYQPEKLLQLFWFLDEEDHPEILQRGLQTVVEGRKFLKNSYIAMLGLRNDSKNLEMHDSHHACLEMFTERLSQLTETNLQQLYFKEGEQQVRSHFRRLAFYTMSLSKYMERIANLVQKETQ